MSKRRFVRLLPAIVGVLVTVATGGAAAYFIKQFIDSAPPPPKQVVQQVRLIRPPPPPPEVEPPPPPPEIEEEEVLPEPEPTPEAPSDEPPPSQLLGLDAEGVAGADGFGLTANKGGRGLLASGGDRYAWYAGVLKEDLLAFLSDQRDLRSRAYSINVSLWLASDGAVERVALAGSTGDRDLDRTLEGLLAAMERVAEAPPGDLPQPVQIRIVSRL
jgi:periplasmic protein TonB